MDIPLRFFENKITTLARLRNTCPLDKLWLGKNEEWHVWTANVSSVQSYNHGDPIRSSVTLPLGHSATTSTPSTWREAKATKALVRNVSKNVQLIYFSSKASSLCGFCKKWTSFKVPCFCAKMKEPHLSFERQSWRKLESKVTYCGRRKPSANGKIIWTLKNGSLDHG